MRQILDEILDPALLNSIKGLELIAKIIVEGHFSGINKSKRVGVGHEFSQYRSYQPGDDLRLMDWKMYARSERYYVRQSEVETNINIKFIIDASKSMLHIDQQLSKIQFAKMLAASFAYIALNQGDNFGLLWANEHHTFELHAQYHHLHFQRFLHHLISIKCEGSWLKDYKKLGRYYDPSNREMIIFITDMHDHEGDLFEFVRNMKNNRNEVLVFHLLGGNEIDFGYKDSGFYEDLETGKRIRLNPKKDKNAYHKAVQASLKQIRESMLNIDVGYELFRMDDHLDKAIHDFVKRRNRLLV